MEPKGNCWTLNARPHRFVGESDCTVREHGVCLLERELPNNLILAYNLTRSTELLGTCLHAGIIKEGEGRGGNGKQRPVFAQNESRILGIARIVDLGNRIHGLQLSHDAITVRVLWIFVDAIILKINGGE